MQNIELKMHLNIRLFGFYKIFTKRMFLPLTSIYASQAAGLTIGQIGLIAAIAAIVSIFFETSSGYWADQHGRANSAKIGALLAATGTALYVVAPNFWGIMAGAVVLAVGYSFLAGAMEALIHDSLVVLKEETNYAKVASRAQALSLVANAVFIAIIPLLYPVDKRLPFVAGVVAYLVLFVLASLLTEPSIKHDENDLPVSLTTAVKRLVTAQTAGFFIAVGFAYAAINGMVDILNLTIVELGLEPRLIGLMFAAASLVGAALGFFIHILKYLSFRQYASLDVLTNISLFICYGVLQSLPLAIFAFILNMSWWRYQKIMYQHYVLQSYGTTRYKATLLSLFSNFGLMHEVWIALIFTGIATRYGLFDSLSLFAGVLVIFLPLFILSINRFTKYVQSSSSAPASQ